MLLCQCVGKNGKNEQNLIFGKIAYKTSAIATKQVKYWSLSMPKK